MKTVRDTFVIARRELLERVKSKWFVAMTLLGPVFMVAMIVIPALIASKSVVGAKVEIVDRSGALGEQIAAELRGMRWIPKIVPPETSYETSKNRIRDNEINGFIVIPKHALEGEFIIYEGDNGSSQIVAMMLEESVRKVVQGERGRRAGISPDTLDKLLARPNFLSQLNTGSTKATSGLAAFFVGYILSFILYMVITLYGVAVMRSVVQEKTSRVMELMVAAVKPRSLMAGKILGVGAAGLVQVSVWLTMGAITLAYRNELLGLFGVTGAGPTLPALELAEIAVVLAYFIIGFFFYAAMYAAVGAMVSSEQETQQVQMPVTMLLVIGVLCFQVISSDPRGTASTVMTMVPFWSPLLMPMRYVLGGASLGEVALSLGILILSTALVVRAAAKIYRVGVLMYGKRPSLREMVRWLRY
ncbi:MAG: ABC transporter permease [Deltaproteobacteria bacterium]|nr:ABC transporter permease [Deltaproteobacteria bacterium]MDQ3297357.1 ABC transporter permease [Myxococcota bacterium]